MEEPANKRMAEDQILAALNGIQTSVATMETRMASFSTKNDFDTLAAEIKAGVEHNNMRIDRLYDLRRSDGVNLERKVEQLVDKKMAIERSTRSGMPAMSGRQEQQENQFLLSRRSIRMWPVTGGGSHEAGARMFMISALKVPEHIANTVEIEKTMKIEQPRRSKIQDEILVRFSRTQSRDVIQSYAVNLAGANGGAGIRRTGLSSWIVQAI